MNTEFSPDPLQTQEIGELADILMFLQRCFLVGLSKELHRGKVSFSQFFLLGYLTQQKSLTMTEIAGRMGHTTAAATGLVDRLAGLGYITREHDKTDRRRVIVSITAKGRTLVAGIRQDMMESMQAMMTKLSGTEQRAWLQVYRKIQQFCQNQ